MDKNDQYFEANRAMWDAQTAQHYASAFYDTEGFIAGKNSLDEIVTTELKEIKDKTLLHLQCHFGQDSLSFARAGAKVTAIDFSPEAIKTARQLSEDIGVEARFECCNVYDTSTVVRDKFDIVFTSYGTITWLPDLDRWAKVVADRLNTEGRFYMAEFHPTLMMYDFDTHSIAFSHNSNQDPYLEETSGSYADPEANVKNKEYFWNHSTADVINALLRQNLKLDFFNEHYHSPYNCFPNMKEISPGKYLYGDKKCPLPHVFSMLWRK